MPGSIVRTIQEIQKEVIRHANRKWWELLFHAKYDREKVQAWKSDIQQTHLTLHVRDTAQYTRLMVSEGHISRFWS